MNFSWSTFTTEPNWDDFTDVQWQELDTYVPYPISELIAQNILATIQGVTIANGYNYNITAQRHSKAGDKETHLNAIIVQEDPKEVTGKVYNSKEWLLPFNIAVYILPTDTDTTPIDQYINVIVADVEYALMVDRYRGGLAMDTDVIGFATVIDKGIAYEIAVINVEVNYRTNELDPYQKV